MLSLGVTIIRSWGVLLINNPYLLALLFGQVLLLITFFLGLYCKFFGYIIFLVYVGGVMVLISYCLMIVPKRGLKMVFSPLLYGLLFFSYDHLYFPVSFVYGLLYDFNVIILTSFLLFVVLISIVSIVDYSMGILKYG